MNLQRLILLVISVFLQKVLQINDVVTGEWLLVNKKVMLIVGLDEN